MSKHVLQIYLPPVTNTETCRYDLHGKWAEHNLAIPLESLSKAGPHLWEVKMPCFDAYHRQKCCDQVNEQQLEACKTKVLKLLTAGYRLEDRSASLNPS